MRNTIKGSILILLLVLASCGGTAATEKTDVNVNNQHYGTEEAKVGDEVTCPVMSKNNFTVKENSQYVVVKGVKKYYCCAGCKDPLEKDPDKYLKK